MNESVTEQLLADFNKTEGIQDEIETITNKLKAGAITSYQAAHHILAYYKNGKTKF